MKILVTGSTGFIGKHLRAALSRQHHVTAIGGRSMADLTDPSVVDSIFETTFDWVIHCAIAGRDQPSVEDPKIYHDNLAMFTNLHANRHRFGHLINIGSGAEFDTTRSVDLAREDLIYERLPVSGYGASKNAIARIVDQEPRYRTLRVFGSVGPEPARGTLLRNFLDAAQRQERFQLRDDRYFDWFNLDDLSSVISKTLDGHLDYSDMNLVYAEKLKISDLLIRLCTKRSIDRDHLSIASSSDLNYTGDHTRLSSLELDLIGLDQALEGLR